jgi:Mrp family chromosome partitioning ATPase
LQILSGEGRVIAFLAPQARSGTSTVTELTAEMLTRIGHRTLLVDMTLPVNDNNSVPTWVPGENRDLMLIEALLKYDFLSVRPTSRTRFRFNDVAKVREAFAKWSQYDFVIADLPPVFGSGAELLNPLALAAAADKVILVCPTSLSNKELEETLQFLQTAEVSVSAIVVNDVAA